MWKDVVGLALKPASTKTFEDTVCYLYAVLCFLSGMFFYQLQMQNDIEDRFTNDLILFSFGQGIIVLLLNKLITPLIVNTWLPSIPMKVHFLWYLVVGLNSILLIGNVKVFISSILE